ncbi:MAG: hypothetical protein IT204_16585 [Fimbriimonadaceae bacterium]|nr:hypothetical protein [Fimbriimonadaceae bacterium]
MQQIAFEKLEAVQRLTGDGLRPVDWLVHPGGATGPVLVEVVSAPFLQKDPDLERTASKFRDSLHALACVRCETSWGEQCGRALPADLCGPPTAILLVAPAGRQPPLPLVQVLRAKTRAVRRMHGIDEGHTTVLAPEAAEQGGWPCSGA